MPRHFFPVATRYIFFSGLNFISIFDGFKFNKKLVVESICFVIRCPMLHVYISSWSCNQIVWIYLEELQTYRVELHRSHSRFFKTLWIFQFIQLHDYLFDLLQKMSQYLINSTTTTNLDKSVQRVKIIIMMERNGM